MKKIIIAVMGAVVVIGAGLGIGVYTQREQTPKKTDTKQYTRKHTKKSTHASVKKSETPSAKNSSEPEVTLDDKHKFLALIETPGANKLSIDAHQLQAGSYKSTGVGGDNLGPQTVSSLTLTSTDANQLVNDLDDPSTKAYQVTPGSGGSNVYVLTTPHDATLFCAQNVSTKQQIADYGIHLTNAAITQTLNQNTSLTKAITDKVFVDADNDATPATTATSEQTASKKTTSTTVSHKLTDAEALTLLKKSSIPETETRTAQVSQKNPDGSLLLVSYPGAKGENHFVLRPINDDQVKIDATYGTAQGGFTPFEDQSQYGPSSVTVSR
ncbi:hypothetical protein LIX87_04090 [Weissella viridescens]|uniref:hypothetical protein n=1 Tax=Weissella viridescens TaxID=1629 RepID=UPI001D0838BF|nr:hypothetical protein [Weissella viridescens]MCB6840199.1 hypothetical protein [Weissella viridescens]MCB6846931.1 hypothetical protein [Weissella viridescens]